MRQHKTLKSIWISWQDHRRTSELCKYFDIQLWILKSPFHGVIRYPLNSFRTLLLLLRYQPEILFVQNPSIVLTCLACLLKPLLGYRLIVDAHNAGVSPDGRYSKFVYFFCKYAHRKADVTIVTNPGLAQIIKQNKGEPLILQDRVPQLDISLHLFDLPFNGKPNVVYICSFGNDEPYREVISAAGNLVSSVNLYVTGNMKNCPREIIKNAASNIHFTGFLPDEQYLSLIHSADCIIDLTEREDCLVCGAYEAVAAQRPVILSDTKALRNYFYKGVIYTEHSVSSIGNAILECIVKRDELGKDIVNLRTELEESWLKKAHELNRMIYDL